MSSSTNTNTNIPLPTPPFIEIPGLRNFRDAGGYPISTNPSKMVRRGIIFRSSEPSMVTDQGIALMNDKLGIKYVYDLRSQTEIDKDAAHGGRQVKEWAGAERVFVPVFSHEDYSPEAIAVRFSNFAREGTEGFVKVYTGILEGGVSPGGTQPFATILRHLASVSPARPTAGAGASLPPAPVLIHCTAGKDRTGVIVALILSLCGVPDDAVAHEYSLTDLGLGERKEEFVSHLIRAEPLKGDRAAAERMVSSRRENMAATLAMIKRRWGGVEEYVRKEVGLRPEEVEAIRANLVVDVGGEQTPVDWEEHVKLIS